MTEPTVHVIDDEKPFLVAIARLFRAQGFKVRTFSSPGAFLQEVTPRVRGCAVIDLHMPGMNGLALQAAIMEAGIALPVIFLTGQGDIPASVRAMRGGAIDFLEKHADESALIATVRMALEREVANHEVRVRELEARDRFARLTVRERETLMLVLEGLMNKQIAAALGIGERAVKMHRTAIVRKVGVRSTVQLAALARLAGLTGSGKPE